MLRTASFDGVFSNSLYGAHSFSKLSVCLRRVRPYPNHRVKRCTLSTATAFSNEKPYYVTTPIFYVNAAPHIGHLYSMVLGDVLKRWHKLKGEESLLCTGTDEHGMKVQQAANKAGKDPRSFCDQGAEIFKKLANKADISYDRFIRTTDREHIDAVQYAWAILRDHGHIYQAKHEGWYSISDETFYPQSGVELIIDPPTGRKIMASRETGKEVQWTSEINYKFRLSNFRDQLLDFYDSNPNFVRPRQRMQEVTDAVKAGLEDLSISRPFKRLTWGVPVPNDDDQTIYVWLDALINYITKAGYPWPPGHESAGGWPADCHVVGKDIVRFHCIYWPAFLFALGLSPPKQVLTHAHWTLGKAKMAKSTGNVVNPFFAIDRFGVDPMRYYLTAAGGITADADYSNEFIVVRYKKELQGGLGNLASRITRGKKWSVSRAVARMKNGEYEDWPEIYQMQRSNIENHSALFAKSMDNLEPNSAIASLLQIVFKINAFLQEVSPWTLTDQLPDSQIELEIDRIIYVAAEALRITGILLQPIMPSKMSLLLDQLGVDEAARSFGHAKFGNDLDYGVSKVELLNGHRNTLFPPLICED